MDKKDRNIKFIIALLLSAIFVFVDQLTKYLIVKDIPLYGKKVIIEKFFSLYYVQNTGSAFSFMANVSWGIYLLSALSLIMTLVLCFVMLKTIELKDYFFSISLMLIIAGASGNLIDRFRLKYVVDFLRFDFGTYTFPIFNVADMCAVVGTFLVIFIFIFQEKRVDALCETLGITKKKESK